MIYLDLFRIYLQYGFIFKLLTAIDKIIDEISVPGGWLAKHFENQAACSLLFLPLLLYPSYNTWTILDITYK